MAYTQIVSFYNNRKWGYIVNIYIYIYTLNHVSPTTLGIKTLVLIYGMGDNQEACQEGCMYRHFLDVCSPSDSFCILFWRSMDRVVSQLIQRKLQIRGYLGMYQPWSVQRSHMTPQPWKLRRAKAILQKVGYYEYLWIIIIVCITAW